MLALAYLHLSLGGGDAFTLVGGSHLILIFQQRRHGGVFVAHLVEVGRDFFPCVIALSLVASQHGEEVDGVTVGVPCQEHAALSCLCHQRRFDLTVAGVVVLCEVCRRVRGDGGFGLHDSRRDGHELAAIQHPAVVEAVQQVGRVG